MFHSAFYTSEPLEITIVWHCNETNDHANFGLNLLAHANIHRPQ